jgi:hypothetical protein
VVALVLSAGFDEAPTLHTRRTRATPGWRSAYRRRVAIEVVEVDEDDVVELVAGGHRVVVDLDDLTEVYP